MEIARAAISILLLCGLAGAAVYTLAAVACVSAFGYGVPEEARAGGREWPPLSLLKPIHGLHGGLEENIASMFAQDYPQHEILFGFQDPDDPAIPVVESVAARFPRVPCQIVRVPEAAGPNRKARVLAALAARARHGILVVSDQDMRVDPRYLRSVAAGFDDVEVGLVTCPYRTLEARGVGAILEALSVNVDFMPSVLVARQLEGLSFALGATMAVRREALRGIGGFEALQPLLADDYELGNRLHRQGWRLALSTYVVDNSVGETTFGQFFRHQLRWARGYRVCRPLGYFFGIVMNGTVFAAGLLSLWHGSAAACALATAWLALRLAAGLHHHLRLGGRAAQWPWMLLLPLKDLLNFALWALAWIGDEVEWGHRRFRLKRDGSMSEI